MNKIILVLLLCCSGKLFAQKKVDSIFVNLYTDSLKKGNYNYINVDGLLSNGTYLPLDSTYIAFSSDQGVFHGNNLLIGDNPTYEKVRIKVALKSNPIVCRDFVVYIKKMEDPPLPSQQQILDAMKAERKKGKN